MYNMGYLTSCPNLDLWLNQTISGICHRYRGIPSTFGNLPRMGGVMIWGLNRRIRLELGRDHGSGWSKGERVGGLGRPAGPPLDLPVHVGVNLVDIILLGDSSD